MIVEELEEEYDAKREALKAQKEEEKTKVTADNMFKDIEEDDDEGIVTDDSDVTDEIGEIDESDKEK